MSKRSTAKRTARRSMSTRSKVTKTADAINPRRHGWIPCAPPPGGFATNIVVLNEYEFAVVDGANVIFKYNINRNEWSRVGTVQGIGIRGEMVFDRINHRLVLHRGYGEMITFDMQNGKSMVLSLQDEDCLAGTGMVSIDGKVHRLVECDDDSAFAARHAIWNEQQTGWDVLSRCCENRYWIDYAGALIHVPSKNIILAIVTGNDEGRTYPENFDSNNYDIAEIWRCNIETGRWESTSKIFKLDSSYFLNAILTLNEQYIVIRTECNTHVLDIRDESDFKLWTSFIGYPSRVFRKRYHLANTQRKMHAQSLVSGWLRLDAKICLPAVILGMIRDYCCEEMIHFIKVPFRVECDHQMIPFDKVLSSRSDELTKVWIEMADSDWCETCQLWVPQGHSCSNFML